MCFYLSGNAKNTIKAISRNLTCQTRLGHQAYNMCQGVTIIKHNIAGGLAGELVGESGIN